MITIYHLGVSQSDRIVWLAEELGLPYELEWFDRGADGLAPPEYLDLHPAGTAPVIRDGDRVLTESAVIVEYLCHTHGGGRFTVGPDQPNYYDYLYWMHWNNNVQGLFFATLAMGATPEGERPPAATFIDRRWDRYLGHLDTRLGETDYVAGAEFTCADVMVTFNLTSLAPFGGRSIDHLKNAVAYVERIGQRPAYQKAMAIAGPAAQRPTP